MGSFFGIKNKAFRFFLCFGPPTVDFLSMGDGFESLGVDVLKVPLMTNLADVSTKNPYFFFTGPSMGSAKVL